MPADLTADPLASLDTRRSVPAKQLDAPGPSSAQLLRMLQSAVRVPDHGKRVPFRFLTIQGGARNRLGERLAQRSLELDPECGDSRLAKERARFSHAPLVVCVIATLGEDAKIPEQERLLTAGCVCFALLQSAQALGFGANWLTGWAAYDGQIAAFLGLAEEDRVVGFIHIGTPRQLAPERDRPDPADLLTDWSPA